MNKALKDPRAAPESKAKDSIERFLVLFFAGVNPFLCHALLSGRASFAYALGGIPARR
jgi:hypothetical protein